MIKTNEDVMLEIQRHKMLSSMVKRTIELNGMEYTTTVDFRFNQKLKALQFASILEKNPFELNAKRLFKFLKCYQNSGHQDRTYHIMQNNEINF